MSVAEIRRELCRAAYRQNIMREGTVRQWCRLFKDGRADVHDEERSGRPFVVSDNLVQSVDQKMSERQRFIISELSCQFSQNSRTILYELSQVLRKMGSENAHGCAQNAENGVGFCRLFFTAIAQRWR
jgi:hypothetical protein